MQPARAFIEDVSKITSANQLKKKKKRNEKPSTSLLLRNSTMKIRENGRESIYYHQALHAVLIR